MSEKLVLIDGHSILNRAFFGLPDLTNSEGLHTNAVYGFLNILFKILEEEQPDYLTVAFDVHAPTFRHKMYEAYKGTRKPMDDALRQQVPLMKEMLAAMGVCTIEMEGYEADDLLGTLAGMGERAGMEVSVVSGDRDLLQLATDHVRIRIPKTKRTGTEIEDYLAADVKERYQVTPKEFIDVKALMGDTADNIPGVPGIGEKTATALIGQYGCIEEVHAHADVVKPPRASKNIVEYWDQAVMSKELATIITDVPVDYDFANAKIDGKASLYTEEAYLLCKRLEFKNLLNRFTVDAPKNHAEESFQIVKDQKTADRIWKKAEGKAAGFYVVEQGVQNQQLSLFDTAEEQKFAGLAISFSEEDNYLMVASQELPAEKIKQDLLERQELYAADLKPALAAFDLHDVPEEMRTRFFDRTIAAYLLNPLKGAYPYEDIAKDYLGLMIPSRTDLLGKQMPGDVITEKEADVLRYACWESYITWKSAAVLKEGLKEHGMEQLMREIEMPLVFVLSDMEQDGICIDANALKEYGQKLSVSIGELEQKIYEEAGETFNINSPKQLGVILFEKMQLPNGKKTKTGFSTSAEVLEKLAGDYPGDLFVDSDYSQIELRLLAHMSGDEQLIEAFRENQDIHRSTASKVFHVPFDEVTDLQRRNAKAVNFGIVYGISAYGLSQDLNIGTKEAQGFIDSYFETYPKIKEFLDNTVAQAKEKGYTRTLFGRIRPIPELSSGNFMTRQFGERVAMNAPIQGTAADIIKIAMIRVHDRLIREHFRSRLILQVHDELLIETAEEEKEKVIALLEEEMQKAADLKVELAVGTACGQDWYEAH